MIPVLEYNIKIFTVDPVYLALLSSNYTHDQDVVKKGLYVGTQVVGRGGTVVYFKETRGSGFAYTGPYEVEIVPIVPGPYTAFILLSWYYPGYGVFVKKFRIANKKSPGGNPNFLWLAGSLRYLSDMQMHLRDLRRAAKAVQRRNTAGPARPSSEVSLAYPNQLIYQSWNSPEPQPWFPGESYVRFSRVWTGTRTPGFWSKRRSQLPVNGHTVTIREVHANTLLQHKEWPDTGHVEEYVRRVDGVYYTTTSHYPLGDSADNQALSRLIDKMGASTANLAQDIGELGETIFMIGKTINRIHHANEALQNGNFADAIESLWTGRASSYSRSKGLSKRGLDRAKSGLSVAKSLAENWLELQYGWKPLLADVRDALEKSSRFFQGPGPFLVMSSKGSATDKFAGAGTKLNSPYATGPVGAHYGLTTLHTRKTVQYGVRWKLADAHVAFLAQTGFLNPVDLAWELLPYSFVVDWFLPIGPWLESFHSFLGLEFLDGYKTTFTRSNRITDVNTRWEVGPPTYAREKGFERGLWNSDLISLERVKLTGFPTPHLPVMKSPWSVGHVLNGLALLVGGFEAGKRWHV